MERPLVHLPELTCPCCRQALGEFSKMTPHEGSRTSIPAPPRLFRPRAREPAHDTPPPAARRPPPATPVSRPTCGVGAPAPSGRSRPCNRIPKEPAEPGLSGKFPPASGGDPGHPCARRQGCRRFPYPRSIHDRRTHRRRQLSALVDPADRRPPHRRSLLHHPHPTAPDPEPPRHDRPAEEGRGLPRRHLLLPVADDVAVRPR